MQKMSRSTQKTLLKKLASGLSSLKLKEPLSIMEVCGTHTTEYFRSGIRSVFPRGLRLIDGPGCPVCVTTNAYLDRAIQIGIEHKVVITTFGDMMRVPSSHSSLSKEKSRGMDIRIVYSPFDALQMAIKEPEEQIIFLSIGFETTLPLEAIALQQAKRLKVHNFSMLIGNKMTPPAVEALLKAGEVKIDGFILPGHVSTIIGEESWKFVAGKYHKASVIAGFMHRHLLTSTIKLIEMIESKDRVLYNDYREAVSKSGNTKAQNTINDTFQICDSVWRGIGTIKNSGFKLRQEYSEYDTQLKFPVSLPKSGEDKNCRCGEILTGMIQPPDCPLFEKKCTPENPIGACMVSYEGTCAAYYKYYR
jgi:hydrogenase expression/formation protein HypD